MTTPKTPATRYSHELLPFVVTDEVITKAYTAVKGFTNEAKIKVQFENDIEYDLADIKKTQEIENSPRQRVKGLRVYGRSDDCKKSASIDFRDSSGRGFVSIELSGLAGSLENVSEKFDDLQLQSKPWYSSLSKQRWSWYETFVIWILTILILLASYRIFSSDSVDFSIAIPWIFPLSILVAATQYLISYGVFRLRICSFPEATFAIGQGKERHLVMEKFRWGVLFGFIVSALASLFIAILLAVIHVD